MSRCYYCQKIDGHHEWCVGAPTTKKPVETKGTICPMLCGGSTEMHILNCPSLKKPIEIPIVPEDAVVPQFELKCRPGCPKAAPKVHGTTVDVKRENFDKFSKLISNQFNHGGDKYKLQGFEDREATDVISSVFGGESEFDWILGTCMKYLFRFKNFHREKDLLKIATYCYLLWLKQGNHLKEQSDEDTTK